MRFSAGVIAAQGSVVLPTYTLDTDAAALVTAMQATGATVTRRRQMSIDWAIRTLKGANKKGSAPWGKIAFMYKAGQDAATSKICWKRLTSMTVFGSNEPTLNANVDWSPGASSAFNTGLNLNTLDPAKVGIFVNHTTSTTSASGENGTLDGSGNGLSFNPFNSGSSAASGRIGGANLAPLSSTTRWNSTLDSVHGAYRVNSSNVKGMRNGVQAQPNTASTAVTFPNLNMAFMGLNNNGTVGPCLKNYGGIVVTNAVLTDDEATCICNVMNQLQIEWRYGELDIYPKSYGPTTVTADIAIYGLGIAAYMAAIKAKRQDPTKTVILIGGWRDQSGAIEGMSARGLGLGDIGNTAACGGLTRLIFVRMGAIEGKGGSSYTFEPRHFDQIIRGWLDPRNAEGLDIPIYLTGGFPTVSMGSKYGTNWINSITTADGKTFRAEHFIDASDEGDLLWSALPSKVTLGRESSAAFSESLAGYNGGSTAYGNSVITPKDHLSAAMVIDPYITPGVSASGKIALVTGDFVSGTPALGSADGKIMAFNFRMTIQTSLYDIVPWDTVAPSGYSAATYELFGRRFAGDASLSGLTNWFKTDNVGSGAQDWNNATSGVSTDFVDGVSALAYMNATDATTREQYWKAHENYQRGIFYWMTQSGDSRINATLKTALAGVGFDARHYHRQHPNDDFNWPGQLYVREGRRLVNSFMWRQGDVTATDGTTPRSTKTIATTSYFVDSHTFQYMADPNSGTPRVIFEGAMGGPNSGTDQIAPVPMEAILPDKADCGNLICIQSAAMTHVAISAARMEFSRGTMGEAAAHIALQAMANAQAAQDVSYTTLRTTMLASASYTGEVAPVLPQVN